MFNKLQLVDSRLLVDLSMQENSAVQQKIKAKCYYIYIHNVGKYSNSKQIKMSNYFILE